MVIVTYKNHDYNPCDKDSLEATLDCPYPEAVDYATIRGELTLYDAAHKKVATFNTGEWTYVEKNND